MATDRHVVLVSRSWHEPAIRVSVTDEAISIALPLEDFLDALVEESGAPAALFTRAQLRARLGTAALAVVEGMKAETARVI